MREILNMRKLSAKWVPKCLNAVQKNDRVLASQVILDCIWWDPVGFFNPLETMEKICIHIYDPDAKEQSKD
jgi:hypothetical protein